MIHETQKPRLGFLGLGWIGLQRMAAIAAAGNADIVALADPVEQLVTRAAGLAPKAAQMRALEEMLRIELDGVVIATPSALHASQTVAVLNSGAAVFCQKPLGRDIREVRAAVEAAKAANRLLGIDLSYRLGKGSFFTCRISKTSLCRKPICRRSHQLVDSESGVP
jgi:predicted dehydrogenase